MVGTGRVFTHFNPEREVNMVTNVTHPGLRALLEFESQCHGIQFDYHEVESWSAPINTIPKIEIVAYKGSYTSDLTLPLPGFQKAYKGPYNDPGALFDREVVLSDDSGALRVPVAGLVGHRILVFLSLEALFDQWDTASDNDSPSAMVGKPANLLFETIFSELLPLAVDHVRQHDWKAEAEEYARRKMTVLDRSIQGWRDDMRRNETQIDDKTWEITGLVAKNERLRESLAHFNQTTLMQQRRHAIQEHEQLVRLVQAGTLRTFSLQSGCLEFETGEMDVLFDGNIFRMGSFSVRLGLTDGTINIFGLQGSRKVDGYCHPHVSSSGSPCLGNMAPILAQDLGSGRLVEAVTGLLEFLRSYNHGGGYIDIRRWDPDWEDDDDRYDSCYDGSSSHDCAVCSDDGCPYHDGAENRCFENSHTDTCIECGDCSFRRHAIDSCRESKDPWECTECTTSCPWAGDVTACQDTHDGERCKECPVETCKYHRTDDKDDERGQQAVGGAA